MSQPPSIAVIGAGLIGATLVRALQVSCSGVRIHWISASVPNIEIESPRALQSRVVALSPNSSAILDSLGCWDELAPWSVCSYQRMRVWDANATPQVEFSQPSNSLHCSMGSIVDNNALLQHITNRVGEHAGVERWMPEILVSVDTLPNARVRLGLASGVELEVDLVCAVDGVNSRVRELCGFATQKWSYQQQALTAVVKHKPESEGVARQAFLPTGPLALLPIHGPSGERGQYSAMVWSIDDTVVETTKQRSTHLLAREIERAMAMDVDAVDELSDMHWFPLTQHFAKDYCQPGIVLVGDAAHSIHPLAGQGGNLGIADVDALTQELARALRRQLGLGDPRVLRRYQRRRKPDNLSMMVAMQLFKTGFSVSDPYARWLRAQCIRAANRSQVIQRGFLKHAGVN